MAAVWHDLRYAVRSLRKAPGFALLATTVLAAGIGVTAVVFCLVDGALIRPLPFADPDRLVMLWERPPAGATHNRVSPLNFADWSEQNHAFHGMAAVSGMFWTIKGPDGTAERLQAQSVTTAFFDVLGIKPVAGRTFVASDGVPRPTVVVVSERFWRNRMDADLDVVGRTIQLDGSPFTVIGIVPASFQILFRADIWTPFPIRRTPEQRRQHYLQVIARLSPGATLDAARHDMQVVAANIARIAPDTNKNWGVTIEPLRDGLVTTEVRATSIVLGGVVAFVLLIACANVANLLLARGIGRAREMAVRAALGAGRREILRLVMIETALIAAMGGAVGSVFAWSVLRIAPGVIPQGLLPEGISLHFDARVALCAGVLTAVVALAAGAIPAWHIARGPLVTGLAGGGRSSTNASAFRYALAIAEVTAAVVLLSGAGLLLRTFVSITSEDPGFHADSVLTMNVSLPLSRYPDQQRVLQFYRDVESSLATLPGVRSVALGSSLPLTGFDIGQPVEIEGDPAVDPSSRHGAGYLMVSTRYFETLGIGVLEGRAFVDRDTAAGRQVCIVNEEFVRRYIGARPPLGTVIKVPNMAPGMAPTIAREVVGVIRQVAVQAGDKDKGPQIYVPLEQNAWYSASIALRTDGNPLALASAARGAIAKIDKDEAVTRVRTMEAVADEATRRPRFRAELVAAFAVLALSLSAVGVFGVLAFAVRERTREFGIRLALGAAEGDIVRLVLGGGARIVGIGLVLGIGGAAALARFVGSLLYGVVPLDPITFIAAPAVLAITALGACLAPAIRAVRIDPAVTLKVE